VRHPHQPGRPLREVVRGRAGDVGGHPVDGHLADRGEVSIRRERVIRPSLSPMDPRHPHERARSNTGHGRPGQRLVRRERARRRSLKLEDLRVGEFARRCGRYRRARRQPQDPLARIGTHSAPRRGQPHSVFGNVVVGQPSFSAGQRCLEGVDDQHRRRLAALQLTLGQKGTVLLKQLNPQPHQRYGSRHHHCQEQHRQSAGAVAQEPPRCSWFRLLDRVPVRMLTELCQDSVRTVRLKPDTTYSLGWSG